MEIVAIYFDLAPLFPVLLALFRLTSIRKDLAIDWKKFVLRVFLYFIREKSCLMELALLHLNIFMGALEATC